MDPFDYLRYLLALLFVLGLVCALAYALRRFRLAGAGAPGGTPRRLGVVDVLPLDARRRLVLVRRDGVEHLLLLGHDHCRLVEAGIRPAAGAPASRAPGGEAT